MPHRATPTPVRRAACLVLATCFLSACYSWSVPDQPAGDYLQREGPSDVRVDRSSDGEVHLEHAVVRGDSVVGRDEDGSRVSVPLSDVESMQVHEVNGGRTALLVGTLAAGTLFLAIVVAYGLALGDPDNY